MRILTPPTVTARADALSVNGDPQQVQMPDLPADPGGDDRLHQRHPPGTAAVVVGVPAGDHRLQRGRSGTSITPLITSL